MNSPRGFLQAALLWAVMAGAASACINTLRSDLYNSRSDPEALEKVVAQLEEEYRKDPTLETLNDLAVGRVFAVRYDDAIALLREAEGKYPGNAIVAANMGTAFELAGKDQEALRWISESVRRDPNEHRGSEWLHVKILEAKLALAGDPRWLEKNSVLGVDFGDADVPVMPASLPADENGRPRTAQQIIDAIEYQLMERTFFVKPPDSVVADLYATIGDLVFAAGPPRSYSESLGTPVTSYDSALEFVPANRERVERRRLRFDALYPDRRWDDEAEREKVARLARGPAEVGTPGGWLWALPAVAAIAGAVYFVRRRRLKAVRQ